MYSVTSVKATTDSQPSFIMFRQHYVSEAEELSGSPVRSVLCLRVEEAVCAPPAPQCLQPAGGSVLTLADRGHISHWSENQLCLFSPAALRDRCKCSSNLDTLGEISPAALYLFNTPSLSLSSSSPLFHLIPPPGRASLFLPALFAPQPCILFKMWIKVTAGTAGTTESACLQGHLSPSPPPFDFSCLPCPTSCLSSCSCCHIVLDLVSTLLV